MAQMKYVLGFREETAFSEDAAEFSNLIKEQVRVPVFAIEFVPLDIGENSMCQLDHLVVGGALFVALQKLAVVGN